MSFYNEDFVFFNTSNNIEKVCSIGFNVNILIVISVVRVAHCS